MSYQPWQYYRPYHRRRRRKYNGGGHWKHGGYQAHVPPTPMQPAYPLAYAPPALPLAKPARLGLLTRFVCGAPLAANDVRTSGPLLISGVPTHRLAHAAASWVKLLLVVGIALLAFGGAAYVLAMGLIAAAAGISALATAIAGLAYGLLILGFAVGLLKVVGGTKC